MVETTQPAAAGAEPAVTQVEPETAPLRGAMLSDICLELAIELGRTALPLREVLRIGPGSVIDLAKNVGDPVDLLANGKLIAHGELVVVDSALAVRITEIVNGDAT